MSVDVPNENSCLEFMERVSVAVNNASSTGLPGSCNTAPMTPNDPDLPTFLHPAEFNRNHAIISPPRADKWESLSALVLCGSKCTLQLMPRRFVETPVVTEKLLMISTLFIPFKLVASAVRRILHQSNQERLEL